MTKISLEEVPGIAEVRSESLERAGYASAEDVATASIDELGRVPKVGVNIAKCIHETARNVCGFDGTLATELSKELEVDRDEIAAAYAQLAFTGITPRSAEPTLRRLFDDPDENSILRFDQYSPMYRHYLLQAGFKTIGAVAVADIDDLTRAKYIGSSLASSIRASARQWLETERDRDDASARASVIPWHFVRVPAPDFIDWSAAAHIIAHRWYDPDVWDQNQESHEIIQYAKQGMSELTETFTQELTDVYDAAIASSDIDPKYITVIPGHDGAIAEPLVTLAREISQGFDLEYQALLDRTGPGQTQKFLSSRDRWVNQDESLEVSRNLSGESIAIIDDISTSGASFATATHRLQHRGADAVVCLALGLTTEQRQPVTTVDDPSITLSVIADDL